MEQRGLQNLPIVTLSCRLRPMGGYFEGRKAVFSSGTRWLTNGNRSAALPPCLGIQTGARGFPGIRPSDCGWLLLRPNLTALRDQAFPGFPVPCGGEPPSWRSVIGRDGISTLDGRGLAWYSVLPTIAQKDCRSAVVGEARQGNISVQARCCRLPMAVTQCEEF